MQIRNDFSNFSGREYHNSHTHHITKCLHEEEHKKHDGGDFGIRKETVQQDKGTEHGQTEDSDEKRIGHAEGNLGFYGAGRTGKDKGSACCGTERFAPQPYCRSGICISSRSF